MYLEYRKLEYTHKISLLCTLILSSNNRLNQVLMHDGQQHSGRYYTDAIGPQRHTKRREWE